MVEAAIQRYASDDPVTTIRRQWLVHLNKLLGLPHEEILSRVSESDGDQCQVSDDPNEPANVHNPHSLPSLRAYMPSYLLPAISTILLAGYIPNGDGPTRNPLMKSPRALSLFFTACLSLATLASAALTPARLRCEHETDPLGVDSAQPRLSWIVQSPDRNQKQSAYQILVAANLSDLAQNSGTLWDSGKVAGDETVDIAYAGKPLAADEFCYWKVRSWDQDGNDQVVGRASG